MSPFVWLNIDAFISEDYVSDRSMFQTLESQCKLPAYIYFKISRPKNIVKAQNNQVRFIFAMPCPSATIVENRR